MVGELATNYKGQPASGGRGMLRCRARFSPLRGPKRQHVDWPLLAMSAIASFAGGGSIAGSGPSWEQPRPLKGFCERGACMKRDPVRHERRCPPEKEAWKIIFGAFALGGLLVTGWVLFVLLTDTPRAPRLGEQATQTTGTAGAPKP